MTVNALRNHVAPHYLNHWSNEVSRIIDRMLIVRNQPFDSLDPNYFDFILCFDSSGIDRVRGRQLARSGTGRTSAPVILLPGCSNLPFLGSKVPVIVSAVESATKSFASKYLEE